MRIAEEVTFGTSGLDRAGRLRPDEAARALLARTGAFRATPLWHGKLLIDGDGQVAWLPPDHAVFADTSSEVFLGLSEAGEGYAARDISDWPGDGQTRAEGFFDAGEQSHPALGGAFRFRELRGAMTILGRRDAELLSTAKAVLGWHRSHRFCSACGSASVSLEAGWQRKCPSCGASHFPRTDPVVIMLVTRGDNVLVGRSPGWPDGMYSLLAGFVEPGETIEAAVRREVMEEAGITVGAVRYLSSQPWPYPSSLMIGCAGDALDDAIRVDPAELEDAVWLTRSEVASVFQGIHPHVRAPRRGAIAGFLLANWLADRLD
jgi:NAD+ diphosphatase